MDPQINIECMRSRRTCCCSQVLVAFFVFLLAFVVGVLIGGLTGLLSFIGIGAFVVLTSLLVVILVALIIFRLCTRCRRTIC